MSLQSCPAAPHQLKLATFSPTTTSILTAINLTCIFGPPPPYTKDRKEKPLPKPAKMSHPRIEEVSDSEDSNLSDPSEGDIDDFAESDIMLQRSSAAAPKASAPPPASQPQLYNPSAGPSFPGTSGGPIAPQDIASYQCLYPIYFDASRTRAEGRRVPASLAVKNPLAREIANACAALRIQPVFEAHKLHPKDWANPGRVRVHLKDTSGKNPYIGQIKNKHHLYILVAKHLKENPTTEHSDALRRVRIPGLPTPEPGESWPRPAVPRGWKINELLPAYSAAMTGGGVSENALKDIMKEMGGDGWDAWYGGAEWGGMPGLGGGVADGSEGGGGGKKNKKGKGKA
ncbi:signal recognition particle, SRP19 subunit [Pseudomassariella vexata]|uniref:Signal recognition particle, SRP19 subunit n=1 Tax=Pseudomassariella vexata TaxID=1141098 RepID=A0A1Y2D743_9PEZI|nr:signal recognition particle, SRP19 subunit [Pseudomassariella vexata]ORY55108.1 signal recognition particle, SRP19 subunit [Pseudomassariella vexata]